MENILDIPIILDDTCPPSVWYLISDTHIISSTGAVIEKGEI